MSLQVWLPLNGSLENKGLATLTSSGTATYKTGGKLGANCFNLNSRVTFTCSSLANKKIFSIAFWAKVNEDSNLSINWVDVIGFTDISSSGTSGQLRWETCYGSGLENRGISGHDNATFAITPYTATSGTYPVTVKNVWEHRVFTVSATKCSEYINGELKATYEVNGGHLNGTFWIGQDDVINGELQDVRIYDHCLSEKEIKQLSQGLVLHLPLNNNGLGQENLLPVSGSTIINSTNFFEFQGWVQNFYTKTWINEHLTPGKQYTLSYTVTCLSIPDSTYSFKEDRHSPILVHQGWGWNQTTTTSDGIKSTNMSVGQSRDYKCTFTFATATENYEYYGLCGYTALYKNSSNDTQYAKFRIDNLKLEEGSIATPWSPNSADTLATTMGLNGTTEYDCSGYCNNGIRTGTFSWTSDTPKYNVSTVFPTSGVNYINLGTQLYNMKDAMTVSLWAKANDWASTSKGTPFSSVEGGGFGWQMSGANYVFYCGTGATSNTYASSTVTVNNLSAGWHMLSATYDGFVLKTYIDGILVTTLTKYTTKTPIYYNNNSAMFISGESASSLTAPNGAIFRGNISDVRIYATALSEKDILSLYNNNAYIDSDGKIYGKIR